MGVTLQHRPVHERSGVTFVGVTANVFLITDGLGSKLPFRTSGEPGAAASAKTGFFKEVYNLIRFHLSENLGQRPVSVMGDIFINILGVNDAAVSEGNPLLLAEEPHILKGFCHIFSI